jgi:hypothetical protein
VTGKSQNLLSGFKYFRDLKLDRRLRLLKSITIAGHFR